MLTKLLYKLALIGLGVVSVCLLKFISHLLSVRRALRHVPGPRASSWIWGEEWNLYHNRPGIFYKDWHEKYGKLVRFTGTFGVCYSVAKLCALCLTQQTHSTKLYQSLTRGPYRLFFRMKSINSQSPRACENGSEPHSVKEFYGLKVREYHTPHGRN